MCGYESPLRGERGWETFTGVRRVEEVAAKGAASKSGGNARSPAKCRGLSLGFIIIEIDLDELVPFLGNVLLLTDGFDRAFINTQGAIYTGIGINVELVGSAEIRLVFGGMDAVYGADLHTGSVLGSNAGLGDHMGHNRVKFMRPGPRTLVTWPSEWNFPASSSESWRTCR